ncbi:lysozyme inhibitor LprI family protein [Halomonas ramblicola]|uniref:lysozyme inhibitor LprI family protein n=1 Tax=Halomonas ramblicola TaxID=747349 RepID=UPI0025B56EC6|nr:lysozyme inhibitor LprI family protein [Halomonas ramblicola]MDN3520174.1 lysozyme inhibitor LprI family protein [Halomonas ramblicola]
MKRIFVLLIVIVLSPATAIAQSYCNGTTQRDANICAKQKWEIADRELNRLWKEVKPLADTRGTGQVLLDEQHAWLRQRDAHCEPELKEGGSAAHMFYWSCMEEQTLQRNQVLRALR